MPNINIDDAYILNETGAEVDKVTGLFTKNENATMGEKQMARLNIAAGGSNDNLLDNWYFVGGGSQLGDGVFPINQRGQTSYSNGTNTTIDRWKMENSSISVGTDGLTWTATGDNNKFEQIIENYKLIEGETYTATIDCDISAGSARLFVGGVSSPWPTVAGSAVNVSSGITSVTFTFTRESGYTGQYKLVLASVGSCTAKLRKFKLEKGTVSTLANDAPPNFGEELRKCQRYLWVANCEANDIMASGVTFGTNVIFDLITPVQIRGTQANVAIGVTPYIAVDNTLVLCGGSSALANIKGNHIRFQIGATADLGTYKNCNLLIPSVTFLQVANEL